MNRWVILKGKGTMLGVAIIHLILFGMMKIMTLRQKMSKDLFLRHLSSLTEADPEILKRGPAPESGSTTPTPQKITYFGS